MPRVSRFAIRLSFLYLVLGIAAWGGVQVQGASILALRTAWHLLAVGWLTQLILGVAFWLFPTHKSEPKRGNPAIAAAGLVLLNVGLLLRAIVEPSAIMEWRGPLLAASAVCQTAGVVAWVVVLWPRVKGK